MTTVAAGTSRTFTANAAGQTFKVISQAGAIVTVSGAASSRLGPSPSVRSFGPFDVGQSITVQSDIADSIVEGAIDGTPRRPEMGVIGDSRSAQSINKATTPISTIQGGFVGLALALSGQCVNVPDAGWQCVGGQRVTTGTATVDTSPMSAQVTAIIAAGLQNATIMPFGTNDFDATVGPVQTLAAVTTEYYKQLKRLIGAGIRVWVCTDPALRPAEAATTSKARQVLVLGMNAWLRSLALAFPQQITLIDVHAAMVVASSTTSSSAAGNYFDTVHFNSGGSYPGSKEIARVWNLAFPGNLFLPVNNFEDTSFDTSLPNKLPNSLFLTDTNADGLADNWAIVVTTNVTTTPTVVAAPSGPGNSQHLSIVATAAAFPKYQTSELIGSIPNGSTFVIVGRITVGSPVNVSAPRVKPVVNNLNGSVCLEFASSFQSAVATGDTYTFYTHPMVKDATMTTCKAEVALQFLAAGSCTLDLMQFGVIVLPQQPQ